MSEVQFSYPATPSGVSPRVTEPSAAFKKEVAGTMGSVILFFIVYLLMLLLSIGLIIGCIYGGIMMIVTIPRMITIVAGLGLIGLGIMVFIFLIKFMFAVSRYDNSGNIEITEAEQPKLFAFIRQLTKDTQTPFPKKIFLSHDVNACVFYNSSFWSMFFPVRKNLQIGLGLVNIVSVSEFKAVMAHEFGHFSQRSMKLGSFVYNVNKVIFNMLYENNSYRNLLQGWANFSGTFAFFAGLTARIAQSIQWVLRKMYGVINKSYMSLSREMEFHADAVAASVSGSESLVTALWRLDIGNSSYNITLEKCDELLKQKKVSENLYHNHRVVMKQIARDLELDIKHEMPVVNNALIESSNLSRINFKDQWASHPSTEDREKHLNSLAVPAEIIHETAWILFDNVEQLQAGMTNKIYEKVVEGKEVSSINGKEFEDKYCGEMKHYVLPGEYNGYFDGRQVTILEKEQLEISDQQPASSFADIFSKDNASLFKKINALESDVEVLKAIASKNISTKSFDFDGNKYKWNEASTIAGQLEAEKIAQQKKLEDTDRAAIQFFLTMAKIKARENELKATYEEYFEWRRRADQFLLEINKMLQSLGPIYRGETIPIDDIQSMISALKIVHEKNFKEGLKKWQALGAFTQDQDLSKRIDDFIGKEYSYFGGHSFFETELQELDELCRESWDSVRTFLFNRFKTILQTQLDFFKN